MNDVSGEPLTSRKAAATAWFLTLRDRICASLEAIEAEASGRNEGGDGSARFVRSAWRRPADAGYEGPEGDGGGGVMSVLRGAVFEKAGVNVSTVEGAFSPEFRSAIPGAAENPRFWASGVSLVIHPRSPLIPTVHMNTRFIVTTKAWFGGGADLTPMTGEGPEGDGSNDADIAMFHDGLRATCDRFGPDVHARYKKWCDDYFVIKHRGETRGAGGIFYDYLDTGDWESDFALTRAVGEAFHDLYPRIARRHLDQPWTETQKRNQLFRRGRYAEFNLVYDRGTTFGLKTGGNTEAILMSLPPLAAWP